MRTQRHAADEDERTGERTEQRCQAAAKALEADAIQKQAIARGRIEDSKSEINESTST